MYTLLPIALALVAQVEAARYNNGLRYQRRGPLNETMTPFINTTTSSTTTTYLYTTSSSSLTSTWSTNLTSSSTPLPGTVPSIPAASGDATCSGMVTYYGSVPPTIYVTMTESFEVTLTASNASMSASETLITPPPACESTIMPLLGTFQPLVTILYSSQLPLEDSLDLSHTESKTTALPLDSLDLSHTESKTTSGRPPGLLATSTPDDGKPTAEKSQAYTVIVSTVYATAPYTSTVIVTKKTPVVVVSPQSVSPPPVFQDSGSNPSNRPGNPASPSGADTRNPSSPSNAPTNNNPDPEPVVAPGPAVVPGPVATDNPGLGNIIVSMIRTQDFAAVPTVVPQTTVANVAVAVLPSTVLIGTSAVAIPLSAEVVATVGGQVFTVRPSELAAPGGTVIDFDVLNILQMQPSPTQRITIAPGVMAEVAGNTAVIDGTTYRIGSSAIPTSITVAGVPIGIGPLGLSLPSTTVAAEAMAEAPMVVETAGGLTFSIDQTEVVISGATYRIGSGAPTITTEIDGQTISIGPGGVGLETTTLPPASPTAMSGSRASEGAAATSALLQGSGAARVALNPMGIREMLGWTIIALGHGRLLL